MIVVDASLMIAWLIDEPQAAAVIHTYSLLDENPIVVPSHWPLEVSSALTVNLRRKRISLDEIDAIQERLDLLDISVQLPPSIADIASLSRFASTNGVTVYDASYVLLAQHKDMPLATLDDAMRRAARGLNVMLLPQ